MSILDVSAPQDQFGVSAYDFPDSLGQSTEVHAQCEISVFFNIWLVDKREVICL